MYKAASPINVLLIAATITLQARWTAGTSCLYQGPFIYYSGQAFHWTSAHNNQLCFTMYFSFTFVFTFKRQQSKAVYNQLGNIFSTICARTTRTELNKSSPLRLRTGLQRLHSISFLLNSIFQFIFNDKILYLADVLSRLVAVVIMH